MSATRPPNIIWIMSDDLSWGDLGCFGQKLIRTSNIDRLATEGMTFTHCHSGAPLCAPSRSSLMQGLHQGHATVRNNSVSFYDGSLSVDDACVEAALADRTQCGHYRHSLQPQDVTVAEVLRNAGYATGIFGKWGLAVGDQPGIPNNKGFDAFFGYLNQRKAHSHYPEQLWRNTDRVFYPQHQGHNPRKPNAYDADGRIIVNGVREQTGLKYSFDEYCAASLEFVRQNAAKPFFLYLPYTPPHQELAAPELGEYLHRDWPLIEQKIWAAMITRMDAAVGKLLALLQELDIDQDTLIFFTSDNGYSAKAYMPGGELEQLFRHAGPWKGQKGTLHQGGVRVPTVARWPGRIAPRTTSDHLWAFWDFLPTAAEAAGISAGVRTDGLSILPTLLGRPERQQRHEYLYWEHGSRQAVRLGEWYIHRRSPDEALSITHAEEDPQETRNLAADKPELVKRALEIFRTAHEPTPYAPSPGESAVAWLRRARQCGVEMSNNADVW